MSERKVLNKYYPPDFDPSRLPRVKRAKNRQFTIRLMAPCNMRCKTCGEYIYKGKKFNARKEDVIGDTYLGIQIYRFYIKCTKCLHEITFKTDPSQGDYELEHGAIRNFECVRLAEKLAKDEAKQKADEESTNPMKLLENRTRDSRQEMAAIEALEDIKEQNARTSSIDPQKMLTARLEKTKQEALIKKQMEEDEDEEEIRKAFGKNVIKLNDDDDDIDDIETESPLISSNEMTTTTTITTPPTLASTEEEPETETLMPVNITSQKRKAAVLFKQPLLVPMTKQKQLLTMAVVKKPKIDSITQVKSSSLSTLLASYNDDDDDDDDDNN